MQLPKNRENCQVLLTLSNIFKEEDCNCEFARTSTRTLFPPYDCDGGRAGLGAVEVRDQGPEPLRFRVGQLRQLGQALVHPVETARTRKGKSI